MNKLANLSKVRKLAKDSKGATAVEYALMLFLILCVVAAIVKTLGKTTSSAINSSNSSFN